MEYKDYSLEYDKQKPRLKIVCLALEEKLGLALKDLLKKEYFRIRITEARVKEKDSLYAKLREDGLDYDLAFSQPGLVRDLIGARVVCHNLDDIEKIITTIEDEYGLFNLKRAKQGKEKKWIEKSQEDFGYRGHHVDLMFDVKGQRYQAELQVRTILQDAWATFMHHDVYKGPIKSIVKDDLAGLPKSVSDLFYGLDQMSQTLRNYVEENPISPEVRIKKMEALQYQMLSFVEFYTLAGTFPEYNKVKRRDRYVIEGEEVSYQHCISGESDEPIAFEFLVGGDSGKHNFIMRDLIDIANPEGPKSVSYEVDDKFSDTMVKIWKKPKRKHKSHKYEVRCNWDNIFEKELDYIFSPWGSCYNGAVVDYALEIVCGDEFVSPPKCYMLDLQNREGLNINKLFKEFGSTEDSGLDMTYDKDLKMYRLEFPKLTKTVLCLMHFKKKIER